MNKSKAKDLKKIKFFILKEQIFVFSDGFLL